MDIRLIVNILLLLISISFVLLMRGKDSIKISKRVSLGFYIQLIALVSLLLLLITKKSVPYFVPLIFFLGLVIVIVFSLLDLRASNKDI